MTDKVYRAVVKYEERVTWQFFHQKEAQQFVLINHLAAYNRGYILKKKKFNFSIKKTVQMILDMLSIN